MDYITFNTLTIMLNDRDYNVRGDDKLSRDDFLRKYHKFPEYLNYKKNNNFESDSSISNDIYIFYTLNVNIEFIRYVFQLLETDSIRNAIIIAKKWTGESEKSIANVRFRIKIQLFKYEELSFPIVYHSLQPKFRKLPSEEIEKLKQNHYITNLNLLPKMITIDPVAKYYDYNEGDIIEIIRKDMTKYYRMVIDVVNYQN